MNLSTPEVSRPRERLKAVGDLLWPGRIAGKEISELNEGVCSKFYGFKVIIVERNFIDAIAFFFVKIAPVVAVVCNGSVVAGSDSLRIAQISFSMVETLMFSPSLPKRASSHIP